MVVVLLTLLADVFLLMAAVSMLRIVWFKENGPFASVKAKMEARGGWRATLANCPTCLSFWLCLGLFLTCVVPSLCWPWLSPWLHLPTIFLSAVYMSLPSKVTAE